MLLAQIHVLEVSFIILLSFMLGLSGLIAFAVIARIVEPKGARAIAERVIRPSRPKTPQ